jgi:hypothetical protein
MKAISLVLALLVGFFGLMFVVGSQGDIWRIVVGVVLLAAGVAIGYLTRVQPRPSETKIVQEIDFTGDASLEELRCRSCNAPLSKDDIEVKAGAVFVQCSHCGATYQIEEAPKW